MVVQSETSCVFYLLPAPGMLDRMIRIQRAVQRRKTLRNFWKLVPADSLSSSHFSSFAKQLLRAPAGETGQRGVQTQTVERALGERATGLRRVSERRHVKEGPLRRRRPGEHQVGLDARMQNLEPSADESSGGFTMFPKNRCFSNHRPFEMFACLMKMKRNDFNHISCVSVTPRIVQYLILQ